MRICQSKIPSCVFCGEGCIDKIKQIIEKEKPEKIVVFTDQGIRSAGLLDLLISLLSETGTKFQVYDKLASEPSYLDIDRAVKETGPLQNGLVVAIGGGSVMDAAKLYSVLNNAPYGIRELLKEPSKACRSGNLKSVMIPTTCGTGAEATCNAIVAIPEDCVKVGIVNDSMIPDYVLLDPAMITKLPKSIVAATGVDALAHGVECYTSNKANPLSDLYALACAKLIFLNIREAYANPENKEAKANMMLGAFYGGAAITASGTTAVHALSYPLGGKYHIAHGVSNAILFSHVMAFNKEACEERLAGLCDAIKPSSYQKNLKEKADFVISEIADIVKYTNIPISLRNFGVKPQDLDFLVHAGSQQTRLLNNNCKKLSLDDIEAIYRKVM